MAFHSDNVSTGVLQKTFPALPAGGIYFWQLVHECGNPDIFGALAPLDSHLRALLSVTNFENIARGL